MDSQKFIDSVVEELMRISQLSAEELAEKLGIDITTATYLHHIFSTGDHEIPFETDIGTLKKMKEDLDQLLTKLLSNEIYTILDLPTDKVGDTARMMIVREVSMAQIVVNAHIHAHIKKEVRK